MNYPSNFSDVFHHSQEYLHVVKEFEDLDDNDVLNNLIHYVQTNKPQVNNNENLFYLKKKKNQKILKLHKSLKFKVNNKKKLSFNFTIFIQSRNVYKDQDKNEVIYEKLKVSNYLDQTTNLNIL